jgi:hypothetical protein
VCLCHVHMPPTHMAHLVNIRVYNQYLIAQWSLPTKEQLKAHMSMLEQDKPKTKEAMLLHV